MGGPSRPSGTIPTSKMRTAALSAPVRNGSRYTPGAYETSQCRRVLPRQRQSDLSVTVQTFGITENAPSRGGSVQYRNPVPLADLVNRWNLSV